MFPHPSTFHPLADVVISAVAIITKLQSRNYGFTRRWRAPSSPGTRSEAWSRRMVEVQQLRVSIERRMDLTELSSRGIDDGLPSRQQARLRGMRDVAAHGANTLRRILRSREVLDRNALWDLVDELEAAADQLDALAYGESYATR